MRASEVQHDAGCDVLPVEDEQRGWWNFATLDQAQLHQTREDPRGLSRTDACKSRDRPQVQLGRGLGEHSEDHALHTRDHRFDRPHEVHGRILLHCCQI